MTYLFKITPTHRHWNVVITIYEYLYITGKNYNFSLERNVTWQGLRTGNNISLWGMAQRLFCAVWCQKKKKKTFHTQ